jgi:hypothetical protein
MELDSSLPTEQQRAWLDEMMYHAFLELRLLGGEGKSAQCADLADAFHNIPKFMHDPRYGPWKDRRRDLLYYCEKYKGQRPTNYNYVRTLDFIAEGNDPSQHPR